MKYLVLLLFGAGALAPCAFSQGLTISPVMIEAPADGGPTSLTIASGLDAPKMVQVRVYDWSQANGEDVLTPAAGVRFAPEIFEVGPGKSQTVRFQVPETGGAGAWRVIIDELPGAGGAAAAGSAQLSLRLRYVLAMFAGPASTPEALRARADDTGIALKNSGPGWLKLYDLSLVTSEGGEVSVPSGILYLLSGAEAHIPAPGDTGAVTALNYAAGQQTYTLSLRREE